MSNRSALQNISISNTGETQLLFSSRNSSAGLGKLTYNHSITQSDRYLRFIIDNDEKVRIGNDGNVGIGITNPLQKLEIGGSIKVNGDIYFSGIGTTISSTNSIDINVKNENKIIIEDEKLISKKPIQIYSTNTPSQPTSANGGILYVNSTNGKLYFSNSTKGDYDLLATSGSGKNLLEDTLERKGLFASKDSSTNDLNFKSIVAGSNISLDSNEVAVTINNNFLPNQVILNDTSISITDSGNNGLISVNTDNNELMKLETNRITISGSIIPSIDGLFDIGSGSKRIRHIYVTGSTIWIGDAFSLSVSENTSGEQSIGFKQRKKTDTGKFEVPLNIRRFLGKDDSGNDVPGKEDQIFFQGQWFDPGTMAVDILTEFMKSKNPSVANPWDDNNQYDSRGRRSTDSGFVSAEAVTMTEAAYDKTTSNSWLDFGYKLPPVNDYNNAGRLLSTTANGLLVWNALTDRIKAGNNINFNVSGNEITINSAEVTGSNFGGSGEGIFKDKNSNDLRFKKLKGGSNVSLSSDAESITITSTDTGEVNTVSNIDTTGEGLFKQKSGSDFEFKRIAAGTNISLTQNASAITISSLDTGEVNTASNVGASGEGIFKDKSGSDLRFKKLKTDSNITLTSDSDTITIGSNISLNKIIDSDTSVEVNDDVSNSHVKFMINNKEVVRIIDGKLGIGVNDPDQALEVDGVIHIGQVTTVPSTPATSDGGVLYVKSADGKIYYKSETVPEVDLTVGSGGGGGGGGGGGEGGGSSISLGDTKINIIDTGSNGRIVFQTQGNEAMRLTHNQRLGIGIDNPGEKLEVNGAIRLFDSSSTNNGVIRYNTTTNDFEGRKSGSWISLTTQGEVVTGTNIDTTGEGIFKQKSGTNFEFKRIAGGTNVNVSQNASAITISSLDTGEVNTASNVGGSGEGIFKDKSGNDLRFKKLKAGSNISLSSNAESITISSTDNTISNIDTTGESLFKQKTGSNFEFKRIAGGTNISLSQNASAITISSTDTGEVNTVSNLGVSGEGLFADKSGVDLRFKKLKAGSNISLSSDAESVTITSSENTASNIDTTGIGIFKQKNGNYLEFKRIAAGTNISLNQNASAITISVPSTINTNKFTDGTASLESGELSGLNKLSVYDITVNNNVTISGNLNVNGNTTTINTTNLTVRDRLIKLGEGDISEPNNKDMGIIFTRGNGSLSNIANRGIIWNETNDNFVFAETNTEDGTTNGVVVVNGYSDVQMKSIKIGDNTNSTIFNSGSTSGNLSLTFPTGNGTSGQYLQTNGSGVLSWNSISIPDANKIISGNSNITVINSGSDEYITLGTNSNEVIRVLKNGNVGIGTTNSTERLDVNGNIKSSQLFTDNIYEKTTNNGVLINGIRFGNNTTTPINGLIRYTGSDFEGRKAGSWVSLTSVNESTETNSIRLNDSIIQIKQDGSTENIIGKIDNVEKLRVNSNGIGIGINNPKESLEISGGIKLSNSSGVENGIIRYNTTSKDFEGYVDGTWNSFTNISSLSTVTKDIAYNLSSNYGNFTQGTDKILSDFDITLTAGEYNIFISWTTEFNESPLDDQYIKLYYKTSAYGTTTSVTDGTLLRTFYLSNNLSDRNTVTGYMNLKIASGQTYYVRLARGSDNNYNWISSNTDTTPGTIKEDMITLNSTPVIAVGSTSTVPQNSVLKKVKSFSHSDNYGNFTGNDKILNILDQSLSSGEYNVFISWDTEFNGNPLDEQYIKIYYSENSYPNNTATGNLMKTLYLSNNVGERNTFTGYIFINVPANKTYNMRIARGSNNNYDWISNAVDNEVGKIRTENIEIDYVPTLYTTSVSTSNEISNDNSGTKSSVIVNDSGSNGFITFSTDSTENMRLISGGNLGIGVTNPSQKLDVNGTAKATLFSGNLNGHTVTATQYFAGSRNIISASAQGSFTDIELKNSGNTGLLAQGDTGNMQLTGTLSVDTIDEKTSNNGVSIEGISLKNKVLDAGTNSTIKATNYNVGTRNIISAAAQGSFRDLELKLSGSSAKLLAQGDTGDMQLSGILSVDTINENTTTKGVTIENVILKDGNIGIGITNPSFNLDVDGTIQTTGFKLTTGAANSYVLTADENGVGTWQASSGGSGASDKIFEDNSSVEVVDSGSNGYIVFKTDNTEKMRLISGGNLGIGITNPSQKLDVNGIVKATTFLGNLTGNCNGNANTVNNGVYTTNKLNALSATTSAELAEVISDATGSGSLVFGTNATLVNPALGTPASGILTNCTGTAAGLTAGAVTNGVDTVNNQTIGGTKIFSKDVFINTGGNPSLFLMRGSNTFGGDNSSDWQIQNYLGHLMFNRGNSNGNNSTLFISYTNKIGINDTEPGTMLQMSGSEPYLTLKNTINEYTDGGCKSKIIFEDHGNNALGQIQCSHDGSNDDTKSDLIFSTNNGSALIERIRINNLGNIGLGETSPSYRLQFFNFKENKICLYNNGSGNVYGFGVSNEQLNYHVGSTNDNHVWWAGGNNGDGTELMRIKGNGNVGIGVNNPSTYLVVGDDIGINNAIKGIHMKSTSSETKHYVVGQAIDKNVFLKWVYDATPNNAYASLSTYGGTNNLLLQQDGGGVLIGAPGTTYNSTFHVENNGIQSSSITYRFFNSSVTGGPHTAGNLNLSISCKQSIHIVSGELLVSSDSRIKKNIEELDDSECLDVIRNLGVKKYKYRDPISRGTDQYVRGFIAQDVSSIIPNSVKLSNNYIPNVYNLGNTNLESNSNSSNIYIISSNNSIVLEKQKDITKILLYDEEDNRIETTLKEQINSNTIKIETDKQLTSNVFIYGEEVYDFNTLDKNTIYTTAVGALQEVDRQQQVDKAKITNLENEVTILKNENIILKSQYNDLLNRITILENK